MRATRGTSKHTVSESARQIPPEVTPLQILAEAAAEAAADDAPTTRTRSGRAPEGRRDERDEDRRED
jgi:hypothetical protein